MAVSATAPPSLSPLPAGTSAALIDPRIWQFSVNDFGVNEGDRVYVSWDAPGAKQLQIFVHYGDGFGSGTMLPPTNGEFQRESGFLFFQLPEGHKVFKFMFIEQNLPDFMGVVREVFVKCSPAQLAGGSCAREEARLQSIGQITMPSPGPNGATPYPVATLGTSRKIDAAFQPFEHGFMVWLKGEPSTIFVLFEDGRMRSYVDGWQGIERPFAGPVPIGRQLPARGFGAVWKANADVQEALGYALDTERGYTASVNSSAKSVSHGDVTTITLPDGRKLTMPGNQGGFAWTLTNR